MDMQKEKQAFEEWKAFVKDEELQRQLAEMEGKEELLSRYFTAPLRFGTAGLRGIMAPGVGAMNLYTVARATRGLAQYLLHGSGVADAAAGAWSSAGTAGSIRRISRVSPPGCLPPAGSGCIFSTICALRLWCRLPCGISMPSPA